MFSDINHVILASGSPNHIKKKMCTVSTFICFYRVNKIIEVKLACLFWKLLVAMQW